MIPIRRIGRDDPLYPLAVGLRERVLLAPIGYDLARMEAEYPGYEDRFEHFVAVVDDHPRGPRVVGVVCLLPDEPAAGSSKLMQMAVDAQRRREGIGRRLVAEVERRAFGVLGMQRLYCHSREDAAAFYASCGWSAEGDRFEEAGVPHVRMAVEAESAASDGGRGGLESGAA